MKKFTLVGFTLLASLASGPLFAEDDRYKYSQMTTTNTVHVGAAKLHAVTITDSVAVAFTIYDSTHVAGTSTPIAVFEASAPAGTYIFDVQTQSGIQHVGAASGAQVTISYR